MSGCRAAILVLVAMILLDGVLWMLLLYDHNDNDASAFYFLDVEQGDSQLIVSEGVKVLIDGGPPGRVLDDLAKVLSPLDRRIDVLVMTHPQLDHFGGLIDVLDRYEVGVFLGSGRLAEISAYRELHEALVRNEVPYVQVSEGGRVRFGDVSMRVLAPSYDEATSGELNDSSVVLLAEALGLSLLYTGDIGVNVEERLVRDYDINVDVLKVAHHGSRFSSSEYFLAEATPAVSIIGVGDNTYGHPTREVLERLKSFGSRIFRTDERGLIKVVFENGQLGVYGGR